MREQKRSLHQQQLHSHVLHHCVTQAVRPPSPSSLRPTRCSPFRCTLRFPSTDLCISFSSLLNSNHSINRTPPNGASHRQLPLSSSMDTTPPISLQSVPTIKSEQQVILVADRQPTDARIKHESLPPLSINIPQRSLSSSESSFSAGSSSEHDKSQRPSPAVQANPFLG